MLCEAKNTETKLPLLQTVKEDYALASDHLTHRRANRSPFYYDSVSGYIAMLVKKVKLQMKAHIFDPKDPISIVGFLATFKLVYDTNNIHEKAAMLVLPNYVNNTLDSALNSGRYVCGKSFSLRAVSVGNEPRSRKFFQSYPKDVNYHLKKYATDQAIGGNDAEILRYTQPSGMTPLQYANDLIGKSCRVADV